MNNPYIVCSSARSGTNFFNWVLASHDLGFASAINKKHALEDANDLYKLSLRDSYVGKTSTKIWSRTAHPGEASFDYFLSKCKAIKSIESSVSDKEMLQLTFPGIKFIYLMRINKLRQAISMTKADQSDISMVMNTEKDKKTFSDYVYDRAAIEINIKKCRDADAYWRKWFREEEIEPLVLTYEELDHKTEDVLHECIRFLKIDVDISAEKLENVLSYKSAPSRQADALTENWISRFTQEMLLPHI